MEFEKNEEDQWEKEQLEKELLEKKKLEEERIEKERIERERIERERMEKERMEQQKMENKLYPNYSLFMIPSWGDLLGYPTLGTYANHPVSHIETDAVLFFSSYDYSIETPKGTLHYLFGLGYYFLKFELESGKYVTDSRILTGLVLPDFVYDHMATSKNVTLEEDPDVIIAEKVIKIPIDLSNKSEDHLTFIKGALMRNVFIPHKDIFLEIMEQIRKNDTYLISIEGHKILSSQRDFFNQILVSEKIRAKADSSYLNPTAGLDGISLAADILLETTISDVNLSIIEDNINKLKNVYSNIEFDPMYLFSIIENAALTLKPYMPEISPKPVEVTTQKTVKESIFVSAEDRLYSFINWPIQFKRKAKIEKLVLPKFAELPSDFDQYDVQKPDAKTVEIQETEQEPFELETLKSKTVEFKPLPPPPEPDIKQILQYLKKVIGEDYEMLSIGQAFEVARETARQMGVSATTLHQAKVWEMSKYANIYIKKEQGFGLPEIEKRDIVRKLDEWLFDIEEAERLEREKLERARLEKERQKRLEQERIEREKQEKERKEKERLERIRLEKERQAQKQVEKERLEKIEREKQEKLRLERERLEKERQEQEAIEKEKQELKRLKQERKEKKKEAKKRKKLEKQKKKLEKKKLKEQEKLKNL